MKLHTHRSRPLAAKEGFQQARLGGDCVWDCHPGGGDVGEALEASEVLFGDWGLPE